MNKATKALIFCSATAAVVVGGYFAYGKISEEVKCNNLKSQYNSTLDSVIGLFEEMKAVRKQSDKDPSFAFLILSSSPKWMVTADKLKASMGATERAYIKTCGAERFEKMRTTGEINNKLKKINTWSMN
jgi:hypothetical protein